VDLFAEQIWRSHHGILWGLEARELFDHVRVPFLSEFNINMVPTMREITLPGEECSTDRTDLCGIDEVCGLSCNGFHHKSIGRNLAALKAWPNSPGALSVALVGHPMCYRYFDGRHDDISGEASNPLGTKGAVVRGYFSTDRNTPQEAKWRTIRVMQHELSHNYGVYDFQCNPAQQCIMTGEHFLGAYWDVTDILWCSNCRGVLDSNKTKTNFGG
jgi:hypothetical protein